MSGRDSVREPGLERQGKRFEAIGGRFLLLGLILVVPGILLIVLGHTWVFTLGLVLLVLGLMPSVVAGALVGSGVVARWAARRKPFA